MTNQTLYLTGLFRRNFPAAVREEETVERLLSDPGNRVFTARTPEGETAGAAVLFENNILLLAVDGSYRKRGYGEKLLRACEEAAKAAGFDRITVGAGAGDYLTPGVPADRQFFPEKLREERLDPRLSGEAADFFLKRGYFHRWKDANCFDMRLSWNEFPEPEHKPGETWDGVTYRFAVPSDLPRIRLCTDDIEEDFTPYYMDPGLYDGSKTQCVLLAEEAGEVAGCVMIGLETEGKGLGSVGCTSVRHRSRGRGIATRMILLGTAYLREKGMRSAFLGYTYSGLDKLYGRAGYRISSYYLMAGKKLVPEAPEEGKREDGKLEFTRITGDEPEKIAHLSLLASSIIREYYDPLLGRAQNDYMIEMFQSERAIREQLAGGYRYYVPREGGRELGFLAFYPREDALYLSKWYLKKEERGKGYARPMLDFLREEARKEGLSAVELNVNKYNPTVAIYEKLGFRRVRSEKNDIGAGFYMDDYVYRLTF